MKTKSILLLVLIAMIQDQALVASKHFLIETEDKNLADDDVVGSDSEPQGPTGRSRRRCPCGPCGPPTGRRCCRCPSGPMCFSGTSTVQTRRGVLSMEQLVLGDSVLTISRDKGLIYTEFLGWLDRSANANGIFLKISTSSSSITLTGNHVIFRTSVADGSLESVFADQIETGDKLVSWKGSKITEETVVAVEPAVEKGTWAPFTMEGTLLVDGLLASCYASFPHAVSDMALAPVVRMFPRILLDDEESVKVDGCREVVKLTKKVLTAMGFRQRNQGEKVVPRNVGFSGNATVAALAGFSKHIEL